MSQAPSRGRDHRLPDGWLTSLSSPTNRDGIVSWTSFSERHAARTLLVSVREELSAGPQPNAALTRRGITRRASRSAVSIRSSSSRTAAIVYDDAGDDRRAARVALGRSAGAKERKALGTVVVAGLSSSQLLTLFSSRWCTHGVRKNARCDRSRRASGCRDCRSPFDRLRVTRRVLPAALRRGG
jgi:hypothetical protein